MYRKMTEKMIRFIQKNPTAFHVADTIRTVLKEHGYEELLESRPWNLQKGHGYFVCRNGSSILAFQIGNDLDDYSFNIAAAHTDSPMFKLKEKAELEVCSHYTRLDTEGYGGMICSTWMDRPLSIAGRLLIRTAGGSVSSVLVNLDRDLVLIPSEAIHMDRSVNDGRAFNKQVDMLPLFCGSAEKGSLMKLIAQDAGVEESQILGSDLYVYSRQAPAIWGRDEEFVSSGRLDDQQCVFSILEGFLSGENDAAAAGKRTDNAATDSAGTTDMRTGGTAAGSAETDGTAAAAETHTDPAAALQKHPRIINNRSVNVMACFDNEEVGSGTRQGAKSTFLADTLRRISLSLGKNEEEYLRAIASSFMISADNAHAVHPNHPEHTDDANHTFMNGGVAVKSHAGQKYTSDGISIALLRAIADKAQVPLQFFSNRSDAAGGSTLGNLAMTQASVKCVDIGVPQLAMHSSYETAGVKDTLYMVRLIGTFYRSHFSETESGGVQITM